jgi:hypothetical protein
MEGDAFHWVFWTAEWDVDINMGGTRDVDGMVGRWSVTESEELTISSLGEVIFQSTRAWGTGAAFISFSNNILQLRR